MVKRKERDFPAPPVYSDRGITTLDDALVVQIRHAIGCIFALFADLQVPPTITGSPSLHRDDVGQYVEVQFTSSAAITLEIDKWAEFRRDYVDRLPNVGHVACTMVLDKTSQVLSFTIPLITVK